MSRRKNPLRKRLKRILFFTVLLLILLGFIFFSIRIRPLIISMADSGVADLITVCVDNVVSKMLDENGIEYSDLVSFEKDSSGRVTALITNMSGINRMKSIITAAVLTELESLEYTDIYIPLGSIIGGPMFLGKGPKIPITLLSCTNIYAYFSSEFQSAGINQTRHSVILHVDVSLDILVAGGAVSSVVSNQINIADTVIVGIVPETYASLG